MSFVFDPDYWKGCLERDGAVELHRAIYNCSLEQWQRVEELHRKTIAEHVKPTDSVLDAGCGWGRLIDLMPEGWEGAYLGVDLSPDFIELAHLKHRRPFLVADLRTLEVRGHYDWTIAIGLKSVVLRNAPGHWPAIEAVLRKVSTRQLYLRNDGESWEVE